MLHKKEIDVSVQPSVSVIIPCKNGASWIPAAIDSCLQQSWPNLEVIVVDNGSSDGGIDVARRYASSVTLLECARPGASAARNVGLQHASGDFIQFLDADDVLDRDKIRVQMRRLASAPASAIASAAWARFRSDPNEAGFLSEPVWRDLAPEDFLIESWLGGGMMPNFAWLVPRAIIDRAGPWNERLSLNDDGEFFCRVALASSGILFCNDARGYYRSGAHRSLSRRRDRAALVSAFEAAELCCKRLLASCDKATAAKACATHYQRFIYDAYPEARDLVAAAERRVAELGGSELEMQGGRGFRIVSGCFGWKFGKHCQSVWQKLRPPEA